MLDFTLWTSDIMTLFLMRACITASLVQLDCASGYLVYLEWVFCLPKMGILSFWNVLVAICDALHYSTRQVGAVELWAAVLGGSRCDC